MGSSAMIPDYQTLMRPVLEGAAAGEVRIGDVIEKLSGKFQLSPDEQAKMLPSGKQTMFANRVHWAKAYLLKAGLVEGTRRGYFRITDRGRGALADPGAEINNKYLARFAEFQAFTKRIQELDGAPVPSAARGLPEATESPETPDETLRRAHTAITAALALDLVERARKATPGFFEQLIVELLIAMGYGGTSQAAGRAIGQSGDGGVDGVIDQDPLGVDQIYVQAKRYADGNNIGASAIRDFYGALSLKKAHKGIFITTSAFSQQATETARGLGSRIVLIDGAQLARLMIRYNVGCRDEEVLHLKKIDEDFFESA
jgi:restriction system protein